MLLYLAKIARTPYLTSHGPDANTVVTNPASVPQGVPSQLTASINFAWSNNAFSQNVGAAEYYIDTPPWAGGTAIPMNGTFNSPTVAVNATINTASLSGGRHVIFVRGRGVSDFQGFQTWGPISAAFLDVTGGPTPTPSVTPTPTSTPTPAATPLQHQHRLLHLEQHQGHVPRRIRVRLRNGETNPLSSSEVDAVQSIGHGLTVRKPILAHYGFCNHDWFSF